SESSRVYDVVVLFLYVICCFFFFFQAEDGIRDLTVTGVQTCALPISAPVFQEHHGVRPPHGDLTQFARIRARAIGADHRDVMARYRLADRAWLRHADHRTRRQHQIAFGLAVELVDGEPERLAAPRVGLGSER